MTSEIFFDLHNGLGDRLLDLLGMMVVCHFTNKKLYVPWRYDYPGYAWGKGIYDKRLIDITGVEFTESSNGKTVVHHVLQGTQLCPYNVFRILQRKNIDVKYEDVANMFVTMAKHIKPSFILQRQIDPRIHNAYGIHLRKSDKIGSISGHHMAFQNDVSEFDNLTRLLMEDVQKIIKTEVQPHFFVCSEDVQWREQFKNYIKSLGNVVIIDNKQDTNYEGYADLYDFFSLSCCKEIYQGVKHSGFSVVAAMINQKNLRNYVQGVKFSVNLWRGCVFVNGKKDFDVNIQKHIVEHWGWNPIQFPD